jgi:hypothetical protein
VSAVDFTLTNTALNMVYMAMSRKVEPVEPVNYDAPNNPYDLPDDTCKCGRPAHGGICRQCRKEEKAERQFNDCDYGVMA